MTLTIRIVTIQCALAFSRRVLPNPICRASVLISRACLGPHAHQAAPTPPLELMPYNRIHLTY